MYNKSLRIVFFCLLGLGLNFSAKGQGGCPVTGATNVCAGGSAATLTLGGTPTGTETWTTSDNTIATVDGSGDVSGVNPGVVIISYSDGGGSCTYAMTVDGTPGPISGPGDVCVGNSATYTDAAINGTWSSTCACATIGATSGTLSGIGTGVTTVSYQVSNTCTTGTVTETASVNIDAAPNAGTISGASAVCTSGPPIHLATTGVGGNWISSNNALAIVDAFGNVTGVNPGTVTISYTVAAACSLAVATHVVEIDGTSVLIIGPEAVCEGGSVTLTGFAGGGTWTSSNTTVATIGFTTGVVNANPHRSGTSTITYTATNACGTYTTTITLTVQTMPTAGTITYSSASVCQGTSTSFADATPGGAWSSDNTSAATVDGYGDVYGVAGGTADISYTVTNTCGSASTSGQLPLTPWLTPALLPAHRLYARGPAPPLLMAATLAAGAARQPV